MHCFCLAEGNSKLNDRLIGIMAARVETWILGVRVSVSVSVC